MSIPGTNLYIPFDPYLVRLALAAIAALAGGWAVYLATRDVRIGFGSSPEQALEEYYGATGDEEESFEVGREAVIAAYLHVPKGSLGYVKYGSAGATFLVAWVLGFPPLVSLGLCTVVYVVVDSFLTGLWRKFRLNIEKDLPMMTARLGGNLLVTSSPMKALEDTVETMEDGSVLKAWMERMVAEVRTGGHPALEKAEAEAMEISPSLALVVFQLRRLFETGGTGFVKAFSLVSQELAAILEARAVASSKAEASRGAVTIILGVMIFISLLMLSTGQIREQLSDPLVQAVVALSVWAMAFGYKFLNTTIDEALEG